MARGRAGRSRRLLSHPAPAGSLPLGLILFVADLFHPVNSLSVEPFLNGDVRHRRGRRGTVPMLLPWWEPDHVAGPDLLDRPSPALREAAAGCHDQGLAQ